MHYKQFIVCISSVCSMFSSMLLAQNVNLNTEKRLSQYVMRSWSTAEGMASEATNEMIQTDDGYIWVASYAGLHRFDGIDFTIYNSVNSDIPSANVMCVEKGLNGEVWIGSLHGIAFFKNGIFETPEPLLSTRDKSIEEMLLTKDGTLWFSTKSNHLFRYKDDVLKEFTDAFDLQESTVLSMAESTNGDVFFGTDDSKLFTYTAADEYKPIELDKNVNGVNTLYFDGELIYIGTGRGLFVWNGDRIVKHGQVSDRAVTKVQVDQNNVIWLGTMSGLFRWNPTNAKLDSLTEESGMPNNIVRDMFVDQEGNLWVATYRNGIFFLYDGSIVSYTKTDGMETDIIASATEIADNTYLLGNENCVLNVLQNGEIAKWESPIPLPNGRLKHLFTDSKGIVWMSTYSGLYILNGAESRRYTVIDGFPDNYIRVANEDAQGNVWVGTKNAGLFRFSSIDAWEQISIEDGLSSNYIMSIDSNKEGQLIVGTISGLNILGKDGSIKSIKVEDGLPSNFMFATFSTENFIWIASNDGLTGYSDTQIVNYNTENGFPVDIIYDILPDDQGNFWMPSESSILSLNSADLEASTKDAGLTFNVKEYDKSYGMKNSNCMGAVQSLKDSKGQFWIPTLGGMVRLNPVDIDPIELRPKMLIERMTAGHAPLDLQSEIVIPAGTDRVLIDFTAISYVQADRLQLRYKLEPFDEDWIVATPERNAIYTNLPPADYVFLLEAGVDGIYSDHQLIQDITMQASWWQTLWARVLFILCLLALAFLLYWLRLRALTARTFRLEATVLERTQELENQKEELNQAIVQLKNAQEQMIQSDKMASLGILSAGVAHEINNPLNFMQGGVEGLERSLEKDTNVEIADYTRLLDAIKEGISRASKIVSSLNEFSHARDEQDQPCNVHHMIDNCLTMIQYRIKDGIALIKDYTTEDVMVMGNNGKIHQAFLNIVTNAIQAIEEKGSIRIKTWIDGSNIMIEFTDSGQGIKPENMSRITEPFFSTKDPGKGTGLGLSITYSIIADHKGQLTYSSVWGEGTTARIMLPKMQ